MKDHEIAALVNELVVTAKTFNMAGQLRERIQSVVLPPLKRIAELEAQLAAAPVAAQGCNFPLCKSETEQDAIAAHVHRELYSGEPAPAQEPVYCGCGDQIMPDDGARCGTCVAVKYQPAAPVAAQEPAKPAAYACIVDGAWHGAWKHEMDARYAGFETEKRFDLVPLYFESGR